MRTFLVSEDLGEDASDDPGGGSWPRMHLSSLFYGGERPYGNPIQVSSLRELGEFLDDPDQIPAGEH